MRSRTVLFISFIPILYFGVRTFLGQFVQYYFYAFIILSLINGLFIAFLKKKVFMQYWLGILFSFMFLDVIFIKLDMNQFIKNWKELNFFMLIPAACLTLFSCILQTYRWRIILSKLNLFKFNHLFPSVMIGHLSNHILPAKVGELIKSYHLGKRFGFNKVTIFSTVVVERIFDGILALSFLLFFIFGLQKRQSELLFMGFFGVIIYCGAFLCVVMIYKYKEKLVTLCQKILPQKISNFVAKVLYSLSEGLHILKSVKQLFHVMAVSVLMWTVIAISIIPIIMMFNFQLPFYAPFAILACISLGLTIPSVPGGIGVISFATIFAMKILLMETGQEITDTMYAKIVVFSIVINIVMVLPEVILGAFFTIKTGLKITSFFNEMSTESYATKK